jgi:cell division transport system permease protein
VGAYGARHAQAFLSSLGRLLRNPLASVFTIMVIGLALALPMGLMMLVENARAATGDFSGAIDLTVYFRTDVSLAKAEQLASSARARREVAAVTLIPADKALEEFRQYSGFGAALEALESNPLPHVLNVRPSAVASEPGQLEALRRYFAAWPEVELVQIDSAWVQRFNAILAVLRTTLAVVAGVLAIGVLAVIGNTIRLEIANRRAEIEVTKLVGGSNAFVRRPFLYTGVFYGLIGALFAWSIVGASIAVLRGPVAALATLYGSRFELAGLRALDIAELALAGVALGWLGAWIAAARHLRSIEPRA